MTLGSEYVTLQSSSTMTYTQQYRPKNLPILNHNRSALLINLTKLFYIERKTL